MKKIFTLLALIALSFGANAQRHCDIAFTLYSPIAGTHLHSGGAFGLKFQIKNNGPDTLRSTDSVLFYFTVNGAAATTPVAALGLAILSGDSAVVTGDSALGATWTGYAHDSTKTICVVEFGLATINHVGTVTDPVSTNNSSCISVIYTDVPKVMAIYGDISVYPNPAQSNLNMDVNLNTGGNVSIRVLDVTGRMVLTEDKGRLGTGEHKLNINTGGLSNGIYIYQLMVDNESTTGRFSIAK